VSGAPILEVTGLCAGYDGRTVLHDLDLTVAAGEVVCLLGANGAGKSTALGAMTGLVRATSGTVALDGEPLPLSSTHRIARAGVAHVPEDRSLFPSLTVRDHLRLADSRRARRRADEVDAVARVLDWFPALERLLSRRVGLLSGGEQQMVAIGRAIMSRPRVLLIDEMSLGLAPLVVASLLDVIGRLAADTGCGVLLVEQHVALALGVASRATVLSRGRVTFEGLADELAASHDTLVASYLGD
jgi:ABC-type branched-subunit amino acid transport system ATPase component